MPLYKEWKIGEHALAAIWKIEEPESFFTERTGLEVDIKNDKRRIEHLAGRFLLTYLKADFPLRDIAKDEHGKPRLNGNTYFFSISHSWPYVAAVIDPYEEAGIDIQTWHTDIRRIQYKFLSEAEQEMFANDQQLITAAWCTKEAAYKWNGRRGVEFIEDLPISEFVNNGENNKMTIYFNLMKIPKIIFLENIISIDFTCSYVVEVSDRTVAK